MFCCNWFWNSYANFSRRWRYCKTRLSRCRYGRHTSVCNRCYRDFHTIPLADVVRFSVRGYIAFSVRVVNRANVCFPDGYRFPAYCWMFHVSIYRFFPCSCSCGKKNRQFAFYPCRCSWNNCLGDCWFLLKEVRSRYWWLFFPGIRKSSRCNSRYDLWHGYICPIPRGRTPISFENIGLFRGRIRKVCSVVLFRWGRPIRHNRVLSVHSRERHRLLDNPNDRLGRSLPVWCLADSDCLLLLVSLPFRWCRKISLGRDRWVWSSAYSLLLRVSSKMSRRCIRRMRGVTAPG